MTDSEHKWIETNNQVCGLLRMAHDALACSSLPPRRTWVGLSEEDSFEILTKHKNSPFSILVAVEDRLREKNGY